MQTGSSTSRPTVARALELALSGAEPVGRPPAVSAVSEPADTPAHVPTSYFDPGDFAGERDWWAKQLSGR